jgi:hypothetical protein
MEADAGSRRELFPAPEGIPVSEAALWLVEGEPDAVACTSLGLACVAIPGVGGWKKEWSERFRGRSVRVCFDCDSAGQDAAARVAADLTGIAPDLRIVDLADVVASWPDDGPEAEEGNSLHAAPAGMDIGDLVRDASCEREREILRGRLETAAAAATPLVPDDTGTLLEESTAFVTRYVVLSPAQADAISLWILHTHTLDAADATPYLAITSAEKRCGKTRLLETLELLVNRPWLTGRVTAAVLARKIDAESATLLLDESDAAFKGGEEYAETLRGILNTGHRRGGKMSCCVGKGPNIGYEDFSTFSAKAIAGIGKLPDTVADRSLPIRLQRRAPTERVERFRRREILPVAAVLRQRVEQWARSMMLRRSPLLTPRFPMRSMIGRQTVGSRYWRSPT